MTGGVNWNEDEIHLKDDDLSQMPDSPICPILVKLFLQVPRLTVIPPTFFEHMPVLQVLDLSNTNIVSLPTSISSLSLLREFFLRDCSALIELPTQIGMLLNLKLFDIQGTQLMFLPKEMGKLKNLEILRVSLSEYAKDYVKSSVNETVIPRKMISELKKLKELCVIISVGPEPEWWEEEVKYIQSELCDIENLETLRWYLPTTEVLQQFLLLERNRVPMYANLSNLMLTIGQHAQLTSCLPHGLEEKFEEFKNCLKWINAEGSMDAISKIMASAEALFLSRHWTTRKLSTFNVTKLKYCLLAECNEMETLVEVDGLSEDVETRIKNGDKVGFELLQYLSIHYMNKLQSIWKGPIGKDSLSKLRILSLHTCPKLTSIFTPTIAQNLSCLTELTVEDCPKVTSLISNESHNIKLGPVLPTLEKIFLLDLPVLVNIFVGRIMLENLRTMLIYSCPRFRDLSNMELPRIKKIEGEDEWWKALDCDKSPWKKIFVQLKKRRDLVEQLSEATNSLQHFHDILSHENDEKKSSTLTDIREQMITANTSMETKGYNITDLVQEAQIRWLKPGEVLFILQNFEETQLTNEPPQKTPSGSLFLFHKRVLIRFFRKDSHHWRRIKDERAVGEAHERLKVGNVEAINCYYALNPNFERRSYWMLDQGMDHIILVHYRDITMSGHSPGAISTFSTGSSTLIQGSSSYGSRLTQSAAYSQFREPYDNTSSSSSIEVSSDAVTKSKGTGSLSYTQGIEEIGGSPNSEIDQALRKIEQLSLDEDN